uniref:GCR135 n=1 Tax=Schmidtea mediterranea TaxID=79327 RepID=A0A193KUE1_SCHMD|nr:GCR135 [Schmidtea mediterranea]
MYSLRPKNNTMASINDKYRYIFSKFIEECKLNNISYTCPNVWWYNSCIRMTNSDENIDAPCPFIKSFVALKCNPDGKWNATEIGFFQLCNGAEFLYRIQIEKYFGFILYPIQIIIYLSSIFKISLYDEMLKDFCWRMIIWSLRAKTLKHGIGWLLVLMNSNSFVSAACIPITVIPIFMDLFGQSCHMALFFYLYIMLYRFDVQIRTIKSALFRITIMTPILAITVCLVLDMNKDDYYNYFECQTDIFGSRVVLAFVTSFVAMTIINIYLWIAILKKCKEMNKEAFFGIYRMEYDIAGTRKEISKREIIRTTYVLKWLLGLSVFETIVYFCSVLHIVLDGYLERPVKFNFFITAIVTFLINNAEMVTMIAIIWFNKHFQTKQNALKQWYIEIDDDKRSNNEELENFLFQDAEESIQTI